MDIARYKISDEEFKDVYADDISQNQYEEIYKGNLYCEYSNCNTELIYTERQKGGFKRFFSTKKGCKHVEGCPNEVDHGGSKAPIIKIKGNDSNISDKHIDNVLNDAYKSFYEKLHPNKSKKKNKTKRRKKQNTPITDNNEKPIVSTISNPVTNGEGEARIEGKEPYIYKREVSDLKEEDKNSYKEIHALVDNIRLYDDEAYIDLKGLDGSEFSVYIGNPFKTSYNKEFRLLNYCKKYIERKKRLKEPIICTSIGEIMEIDNKLVIQVYSYHHFKLDNLGLYKIIYILQNEDK